MRVDLRQHLIEVKWHRTKKPPLLVHRYRRLYGYLLGHMLQRTYSPNRNQPTVLHLNQLAISRAFTELFVAYSEFAFRLCLFDLLKDLYAGQSYSRTNVDLISP